MSNVAATASSSRSGDRRTTLESMRFLDIEVEVDRDEEKEDEDNEGIADFMADEDDGDTYRSRFSHEALNSRLRNCEENVLSAKANEIYDQIHSSKPGIAHEQEDHTPVPLLYPLRCMPKKELDVVLYTMGYCHKNQVSDTILSLHY
ncbi:hypothetical protein PM082_023569 [Marasmius tenuissimus]|nr:hypothetical protein PM082_023569 [Marasmius tenuissimus]